MSKRSQEKRRARAREKAKLARRERGVSPLSRLSGNEAAIECWLHYDAADDRMMNVSVFRPVHGGGFASAFFLVDFDCIGLKDAFYRLDVAPGEVLEGFREQTRRSGTRLVKAEIEEARGMLGGAVRWTTEQGFRLPADTPRSLKILGGVEAEGADISRFGVEGGGLHYVGRLRDLEKRLIDETLEEFMDREDVAVTFMDEDGAFMDEEEEVEDEDDEFEEEDEDSDDEGDMPRAMRQALATMRDGILRGVRRWCRETGRQVHESLEDAAILRAMVTADLVEAPVGADMKEYLKKTEDDIIAEYPGSDQAREKLRAAYQQVLEYLETLPPNTDVGMEVEDEADEWDDLDEQDRREEVQEGVQAVAARVRANIKEGLTRWCFASGQKVHERIDEAIALMVDSIMQAPEGASEAEIQDAALEAGSAMLSMESPADQAAILEANAQLAAYGRTFASPEAMLALLGLQGGESDETPTERQESPKAGEH